MLEYIIEFYGRIEPASWLELGAFTACVLLLYGVKLAAVRKNASSGDVNSGMAKKRAWKQPRFSYYLLVIYTAFILMITLMSRESGENATYEFVPFWSWRAIHNGKIKLLWECIWNVILFIPFGCILGVVMCGNPHSRTEDKSIEKVGEEDSARTKKTVLLEIFVVFVIGFLLSAIIETSQLLFHLGLFEWDDMIHNAIGSLLGGTVVWLVCRRRRKQ
ncbi:MAG: VanZ family protein [Lachnospiraceae bacterium]|nr:VanZ family protein [Lachnospiraceae bacterium]